MPTPSFPTLSGGSVAKYPLNRSRIRRGMVYTFTDFSEQRFAKGSPLDEFELTYNRIRTSDKELLRAFWIARRGSLDTTWEFTITDETGTTTTYRHMQFTPGQQFEATETATDLWSVRLRIRRTRKD